MTEKFTYIPKGTCSRQIDLEMEGNVIRSCNVVGGCNGNLKGICNIMRDKTAQEVITAFEGVTCGPKPTSCPDQIAAALKQYLAK